MVANNELDDLVREVIKENPLEEQGIRPEWQNHVGWHRKENIFKLRGRKEGDVSKQLGVHQNSSANIDESNQSLSGLHKVCIYCDCAHHHKCSQMLLQNKLVMLHQTKKKK